MLDDLDRTILDALREDARASVNAIAQRLSISRANAYARIRRLSDSGVLLGYTIRTDAVLEGYHSSAYVALSVEQAEWQAIREGLIALPEVEHVALVGGEFDVLALVRARDNRDLRRIVLQRLQSMPGVRSTRTYLVFEDFDAHHGGGRDA